MWGVDGYLRHAHLQQASGGTGTENIRTKNVHHCVLGMQTHGHLYKEIYNFLQVRIKQLIQDDPTDGGVMKESLLNIVRLMAERIEAAEAMRQKLESERSFGSEAAENDEDAEMAR